MSDNEDLDNLFGAFDGDQDVDGGGDDSATDQADATAPAGSNKGGNESASEDEEAASRSAGDDGLDGVAAKTVAPSASTFAAALSRPVPASATSATSDITSSSKNIGVSGSSERDKKKDTSSTAAEKEEDKAISTGTSHDKSIRSYSAVPDDLDPSAKSKADEEAKARPPAKVYQFKLDPFQQTAVDHIERNESVLVAAHTSAGKTAVAEYAVAKSLRDGQRVIYTSPIKALSNQKYRDLCEEFGDVGLMTGDITINPGASCLVMTTEILRSMLYRGSEVMREVAWVIYDEVHYMRDKERGVVWEESIILLPHRVRFVFLSATIPNARQFVDWIAKIHHQPCHVVYTNYRPVPLQHYIFPEGGEGLHLVVDEKGKFREANFQKAMASLQSGSGADAAAGEAMLNSGNGGRKRKRGAPGAGGPKGGKGRGQSTGLHRIVKLVMERNLNPVIIFSFSKKDCEKYALELHREDYTDEVEKDLVSQVYKNAIESLSEDDRKLPQVEALLPLLKRGIGIHHGGLLPILKEIVEILFSEGLIKALFATETFSIGINMPAKTVVFTNTRKWDGQDFRFLTSGEYIQMSGRAGRRGKDDRGIVIQMLDEKMEPSVCKGILYGDPDPLNSSYRISYNMLLNMVRVEDVDPDYILRASFRQYQVESEAPALEAQAESLEEEAKAVVVGSGTEDEEAVGEYYQMDRQLLLAQRKMVKIVQRPEHILPFLKGKGRLLDVSIDGEYFGWGVLNAYKYKAGAGSGGSAGKAVVDAGGPLHTLDVLLPCIDRHFDGSTDGDESMKEDASNVGLLWRGTIHHCRPVRQGNERDEKLKSYRVFTISLSDIERISAVRIFIPQDITPPEARVGVAKSLNEVIRRFPEGLPLLDPVKDLKITSSDFEKLLGRASALKERIASHKLTTELNDEDRATRINSYGRKVDLRDRSRALRDEARSCKGVIMRDDLRRMKRVLRQLGHVDANGVIDMKGRTACEINTAMELVVVEMVFTGLFNDLSVEQSVAVLSCLTFDERNKDEGDPAEGLKSYLSGPFYKLQECARTVAKASIACKIELDEDEFIEKFNPGMMEAVFAWCKGAKFVDVQKLTGSFEGTTIRTLRRLEELVRQLANASKSIGNHELQSKFEKGSELLKRDIVFCSSLYL